MKTLLTAALLVAVTSLHAYAQGGYGRNERLDKIYEEQQKRHKEVEKQYNESVHRSKTNDASRTQIDPWRNVRPIEGNNRR